MRPTTPTLLTEVFFCFKLLCHFVLIENEKDYLMFQLAPEKGICICILKEDNGIKMYVRTYQDCIEDNGRFKNEDILDVANVFVKSGEMAPVPNEQFGKSWISVSPGITEEPLQLFWICYAGISRIF